MQKKKVALDKVKKTLLYSMRAEVKRQSIILFTLNWERAPLPTQIFHCLSMSMNNLESIARNDFRLKKNYSE